VNALAGRRDVNIYFVCAVLAFSLLGGLSVKAGSNSKAAPPGISEAQSAFHYAEAAYQTDDIIVARTNLHKAINCLVGQKDKHFSAISGDPCVGQGKGAIQDVKDASLGQQLRLALAEASLGLERPEITNVRMHALSAMDHMQSVRTDDASTFANNALPSPSPPSPRPIAGLSADEALSSQLRGAMVSGVGGDTIGTITDLVLDAQSHTVSLVGLDADGRAPTIRAVYWKRLGLSRAVAPKSGYASNLSEIELNGAPRFADEVRARPAYIDVDGNLVGRTILAGDGKVVGKLTDLVIDLRSGRVDFVLVSDNGADTSASQSQFALQWSDIADLVSQRDIVLKLDPIQFAAAPRFLSR
jgi:sporulation protein YlmC with PRC-barrel domain